MLHNNMNLIRGHAAFYSVPRRDVREKVERIYIKQYAETAFGNSATSKHLLEEDRALENVHFTFPDT